jgi:hypothetical protein
VIFDIIESKILGNIRIIPSLASQVEFNKKGIFDISIQNQIDLNASALDIFKSINGQATIEDIVEKMNKKFKCKRSVLRKDITNILNDANKKNLINYNIKSNKILYKLIGKMYLYLFLDKNRRFDITSKSFIKIFTEILKIILIKFSWVICLNIFNMFILYLIPTTNDNFIFKFLFSVFLELNIVLFGGFSSIALHEALHAYYFKKSINYSGGFLLVNIRKC